MHGSDATQETLFATRSVWRFVPADHPLRAVRDSLKVALKRDGVCDAMHAKRKRAPIAPEKLLRALSLQVLNGIRSERTLAE